MPGVAFYNGPVRIERIAGRIELQQGAPPVTQLDVSLRNEALEDQDLTAGFRSAATQRVVFQGAGAQGLTAPVHAGWSGTATGSQAVRLDLVLELDGKPGNRPIDTVALTIVLPAGVPALIRANSALTKDHEAGRTVYRLKRSQTYLTELQLVYTAGPVTMELEKSITPAQISAAGSVQVKLKVRNLGPGDAADVLLKEDFDPRDFAGEGAEFQNFSGPKTDRRLLWRRTIPSVPAGGSVDVEYTVMAKQPVQNTTLSAATASIAGQLVGVSNKIKLGPFAHP
jgi:hypothetical protein